MVWHSPPTSGRQPSSPVSPVPIANMFAPLEGLGDDLTVGSQLDTDGMDLDAARLAKRAASQSPSTSPPRARPSPPRETSPRRAALEERKAAFRAMGLEAVDIPDLERRLSKEPNSRLLDFLKALGLKGNKNENKRVLVARLLDAHERHEQSMAVAHPRATPPPPVDPGMPTFSTSGGASPRPTAPLRRSKRSRPSQAPSQAHIADHPPPVCFPAPASPPPQPTQASQHALPPHDQTSPAPFMAPTHPRSYAAAAAGAQDQCGPPTQPGTPSPLGLCALLDRTMALLHGAIREAHASTGSSAPAARSLAGIAEAAGPLTAELRAARAGLAAAEALRALGPTGLAEAPASSLPRGPSMASPTSPASRPDGRPPQGRRPPPQSATAWAPARCVTLHPPADSMRTLPTDIPGFARRAEEALAKALPHHHHVTLELVRRTAKGGYTIQVRPALASPVRQLSHLQMANGEDWKCHPLQSDTSPTTNAADNGDKRFHRNCFVIRGVRVDQPVDSIIHDIASSNAHRLDMQPAALLSLIRSATRLQRRLSQGPQAGTWSPAASIKITADPEIVAKFLSLGSVVFHLHSHEVAPFTSITPTCFRCGVPGHIAKFCRGTARCRSCGAQGSHETRNCPHRAGRHEDNSASRGPVVQPRPSQANHTFHHPSGVRGAPSHP